MSESSLYVFMRGKDGDPGVMETECAVVINERREEEGSKCGWKDEGGAGMSPQWISKCIQHFASLM